MRIIAAIALMLFSAHSLSQTYDSVVSSFFESITFDGNQSTIVFKSEGPMFDFVRNGSGGETSGTIEYGHSLTLPMDQTIRLVSGGHTITVSSLEAIGDAHKPYFTEWSSVAGWLLQSDHDMSSFGEGVKTSLFFIPTALSEQQQKQLSEKYGAAENYIVSDYQETVVIQKLL